MNNGILASKAAKPKCDVLSMKTASGLNSFTSLLNSSRD